MRLLWEDRAWNDYLYWQSQDKKTLKKLTALLRIFKEALLRESANLNRSKKI